MQNNIQNLDWTGDFSMADEFEFNRDEIYEISDHEFELDGERIFSDDSIELDEYDDEEDAIHDSMSMPSTNKPYCRDESRVNALIYYALVSGLTCSYKITPEDEWVFKYSISLESSTVDASLDATFICEYKSGEMFGDSGVRVDVFTDIAGIEDNECFSMSQGFQYIMDFIEFAA